MKEFDKWFWKYSFKCCSDYGDARDAWKAGVEWALSQAVKDTRNSTVGTDNTRKELNGMECSS